ncbi:MAG: amidohydrolase family protein [Candidatus Omnitrophica bacterium]|nr:amidohydrolase family protein [Candidatus Omnitrophota bacterium]
MIIDGHTHIHPHADGWGGRYDASLATLVEALTQGPVQRAVVLPIAPKVSNDFIAESCRRYPDQLIGFASVDPMAATAGIEELERAVGQLKLKGLKLHPRLQGFGRNEYTQLVPLIQRAARLNVPVLIDAFPYGKELFETRAVELINALAEAVPDANLIMAHAGGYQLFEAFLVAKAHRNVFLDISYTLPYFRGSSIETDLGFVIRKMHAQRIIYGSDHPEQPLAAAFTETRVVLERYGLTPKQMDAVLGENLAPLVNGVSL